MNTVDLVFPVAGSQLPAHHGYHLYAGLSRVLPCLHDKSTAFGLGAVTGQYVGRGMLRLDPRSSVMRLRLAVADVPRVLPLAGKAIDVDGVRIRLGVAHVEALTPAADLMSHFVTIKHAEEPEAFVASVRKKLEEIGVKGGTPAVLAIPSGPRKGEPRRQVMRVKGAVLIGYAVRIGGLTADESVAVQSATHWAKRHMGAAFFVPAEGDR
jgi:CRISPR-associated protein Cas6